jgi:hypothetical protein
MCARRVVAKSLRDNFFPRFTHTDLYRRLYLHVRATETVGRGRPHAARSAPRSRHDAPVAQAHLALNGRSDD